ISRMINRDRDPRTMRLTTRILLRTLCKNLWTLPLVSTATPYAVCEPRYVDALQRKHLCPQSIVAIGEEYVDRTPTGFLLPHQPIRIDKIAMRKRLAFLKAKSARKSSPARWEYDSSPQYVAA